MPVPNKDVHILRIENLKAIDLFSASTLVRDTNTGGKILERMKEVLLSVIQREHVRIFSQYRRN